ncbi:MAG: UPF0755 protein [Arcticibacterium sp.]|jgi:UPF0755 protein
MFRNHKVLAYMLVIFSSLAATFSFYFWQVIKSPNINLDAKNEAVLFIPKGATYQNVLDSLNAHDLIHDQISFGFLSKFMNYRDKVKPGRYELAPNATNKEILSKLRSGDQDELKLTFNNIRLKSELAQKLSASLSIDSKTLLEKLNDPEVCKKYGFTTDNIMCMFLPDTYFMWWTLDEDAFLDRMKYEYNAFWNEDRLKKAATTSMSPKEIGIMASIVQSESNKRDEQPTIAGVYVNRIKQGIPLQADPTVKFAVGDFGLKRILKKHLTVNSPYNTYTNQGLPPGPIALPEKGVIDAVLNYGKHNYVYFCAREDFSGYHNFAANLSQHNANARRFHAAMNQRGIY